MEFKSSVPYPKIVVEKQDKELATDLMYSYAGLVSEDTAIHNYFFQAMMQDNEEIKNILKQISIVEMHHLEILGELIRLLGGVPLYKSDNHWFSGSFVNYDTNWPAVLKENIKNEELAIANYQMAIAKTTDNSVKHILKRIILDERIHIEIFNKLLKAN